MTDKNGNADTGRIDTDGLVTHDFLGFPYHFHFFLGVTVVLKYVNMRQNVKRDLFGIDGKDCLFAI